MNNELQLGVNVDHVATLRQARGTVYPSPLEGAQLAAGAGAHGITIHLREDRRHIQDADVWTMKREQTLPLNLEMAASEEILALALEVLPHEVCLVPEQREELTTEGGLDVAGQQEALRPVVNALKEAGIRVSLFVDPDPAQLEASAALGAPIVELHTGTFCEASGEAAEQHLETLIRAAQQAHGLGLQVNAGHGINRDNLAWILEVPHLDTLNIGHSIIARAVMIGMPAAVQELLNIMKNYTGGRSL